MICPECGAVTTEPCADPDCPLRDTAALAQEREECAKVVETHSEYGLCLDGVSQEILAAAIRARKP
jgi:hypothetical protein